MRRGGIVAEVRAAVPRWREFADEAGIAKVGQGDRHIVPGPAGLDP